MLTRDQLVSDGCVPNRNIWIGPDGSTAAAAKGTRITARGAIAGNRIATKSVWSAISTTARGR